MGELARTLIIIGLVLVVVGLAVLGVSKAPFFGKLPGDLTIKREGYTVYFPLASSIIISVLISLVLYLINKYK